MGSLRFVVGGHLDLAPGQSLCKALIKKLKIYSKLQRCKKQLGKAVFTAGQFAQCLALNETPVLCKQINFIGAGDMAAKSASLRGNPHYPKVSKYHINPF